MAENQGIGNDEERMLGESKLVRRGSEVWNHFYLPLIGIVSVFIFVGLLPILVSILSPLVVSDEWAKKIDGRVDKLGSYGSMFGMVGALFSGVAFAAIYYTLRIQIGQRDLQAEQ